MKVLIENFQTKHNTAPFSQIKLEDYQPAFTSTIAAAKAEIDAIINNPAAPTFENTIEALDFFWKCFGSVIVYFLQFEFSGNLRRKAKNRSGSFAFID